MRILFIPLEFTTWADASHFPYTANYGFEEGFEANGVEFATLPALFGTSPSDSRSWLHYARRLFEGERFDQVWIEIVHSTYDEGFLEWVKSVSPVRIGFCWESCEMDPRELVNNPEGAERRRSNLARNIPFMTHLVMIDERDVEAMNAEGKVRAKWIYDAGFIPRRFVSGDLPRERTDKALFYGTLYGDRKTWLEHPELKDLLVRPESSAEFDTPLPKMFDDLHAIVMSRLSREGVVGAKKMLAEYLDAARTARREAFSLWLDDLKAGLAVVNLPQFGKAYAGRVLEGMAAGRPVVTWEIPDRPRTKALFRDGEEILLYPKDDPQALAAQLRRLRNDPELAGRLARNARRKVDGGHTTEHLVRDILAWSRGEDRACLQDPQPAGYSANDFLREAAERGVWRKGEPLRLHLGCGENRLEGYVNVDYAATEHNVMRVHPDVCADIARIALPDDSVDEIRLHHVFEHFNRVTALALLIRWHRWLKVGGKILIETPDIVGSAKTLLSDVPLDVKMGVVRHLAGDQAASWAFHVDHWFPERFIHTLNAFGFVDVATRSSVWNHPPYLSNVEVVAVKGRAVPVAEQLAAADRLLCQSMVANSEKPTWEIWRRQLREAFRGGRQETPPDRVPVECKDAPRVEDIFRFYEENLLCPETHERLRYRDGFLESRSGGRYRMENGIPCFVGGDLTESQESELEFTENYIREIIEGKNALYDPERIHAQVEICWKWATPWINGETVSPDTRIVCVGGSFVDDLPHVHSTFKFNVDHLAHRYLRIHPGLREANTHYVASSAERLPFGDEYADIVYMRNSLDHVANPIKCLQEAHRILKGNGRLFLGVYHNSTFINEHESTVIDEGFISSCVAPLFHVEHREIQDVPQQRSIGGRKTGFIHLVCRKRPEGALRYTGREIMAVEKILAHFHSALYKENRRRPDEAARSYGEILLLEPVFPADVYRAVYAYIRWCAIRNPNVLPVLYSLYRKLGFSALWEDVFGDAADGSIVPVPSSFDHDGDLAAFVERLDVSGKTSGWRILRFLAQTMVEEGNTEALDIFRGWLPNEYRPDGDGISTMKETEGIVADTKETPPAVERPDASPVTTVIFSKDRPLQLDATLKSLFRFCSDVSLLDVHVLYKASSGSMESHYADLRKDHASVDFIPEKDFRNDLLAITGGAGKILFLVDDNLFVRQFGVGSAVRALDRTPDALGFSLRLGKNTIYCYPLDAAQSLPDFRPIEPGILAYPWEDASLDFGYPLEVSSSIYRADEILPLLNGLKYKNPNTLEAALNDSRFTFSGRRPLLLTFERSVTFCAPLNRVQDEMKNRAGGCAEYSPESLADLYGQGYRLDPDAYEGLIPEACHKEVKLQLRSPGRMAPLVSVVIPCYNQAAYLPSAVESVVAQTSRNWEIVIVNDGSRDDTSEVSRKLIAKHRGRRIRLIEKENGGLANARNTGIREAAGEYILPLDSDDMIHPEMIAKTVRVLESDRTVSIAHTDTYMFGTVKRIVRKMPYDFRALCRENFMNYCSLYRKKVWEEVGGYNHNMKHGYEDWDFWIGCGERGHYAAHVPETLFFYRIKEESMLTKAREHDLELRARIVLNHPSAYDHRKLAAARELLGEVPDEQEPPPEAGKGGVTGMDESSPIVSVIVPTFNRPDMFRRALESILAQSLRDIEIVVVNDAGKDVEEIVASLNHDGRITYVRHDRNRGLAAARNTGLRLARGKYIAYLDDDDLYYPDHLETLVSHLEKSGVKVAYTDAHRAIQKMAGGEYVTIDRDIPYSRDFNRDLFLVTNYVPVLCFMHEKACLEESGCFDETLTSHEDWDLWIRMSRKYDFAHIKKVTCEFSWRTDGTTMTSGNERDYLRTMEVIHAKYRHIAKEIPQILDTQMKAIEQRKIMGNNATRCPVPAAEGRSHKKARRFAEAIEAFRQARSRGDLSVLVDIGDCLAQEGKLEEAASVYREAVTVNPCDSRALAGLGVLELMNGNPAGASERFTSVLETDDRDATALCGMGLSRKAGGEGVEAFNWFMRALDADPVNDTALHELVKAAHELGRLEEAERYLSAYLQYKPGDPHILFSLAGIFFKSGKRDEALDALDRLVFYEPSYDGASELRERIALSAQTV